MRTGTALAVCAVLSGCVSDGGPIGALEDVRVSSRTDSEEINHCLSLQMVPGTLVYAQCRLAMRQTLQDNSTRIGQRLRQVGGALPEDVETAVRDNAACNLNASANGSLQPGDARPLAVAAFEECGESRDRLHETVLAWQPLEGQRLVSELDEDIISTNEATITQSRELNQPVSFGTQPGEFAAAGLPTGAPGAGGQATEFSAPEMPVR